MNRSNQSYLFGSYLTPISSLHYSSIFYFTALHPLLPFRTSTRPLPQETHTPQPSGIFLSFQFNSLFFPFNTTPAQSDT